jgi:hypothetical protein
VILAVLPCVTAAFLPQLRVLVTVAGALRFFVVAALVANNTGLLLGVMDVRKRFTAAGTGAESSLITSALPAPPVLSAVFVWFSVFWLRVGLQ